MNPLQKIIHGLLGIESNLSWIAFQLSGGGDDFGGFEAVEAFIKEKSIKKVRFEKAPFEGESESSQKSFTTLFGQFDNFINGEENQTALIEAILPPGVYLKCTDRGGCHGALLVCCQPLKGNTSIEIIGKSFFNSSKHFNLVKGFKGFAIDFENSEEF